ncbi:hypothetical protein [Siccibacter turicensis]|uniref:hypothetical protein n=1 Tax=Siccibacter turicensis TaxID=357233 RepID=UPI002A6B3F52|nr:hypothetical protein [Siccibacter turicensis]MDY0973322.1 hypothetical protein [Siccibacter turicensis]
MMAMTVNGDMGMKTCLSGGYYEDNDEHVPSAPVLVSAEDSLGHMGFYQLPEENGKCSCYQVYIKCLSMDDMEKFIY